MSASKYDGLTYADAKATLWMRGELSYKLDSLQRRIRDTVWESAARIIAILSSRQIGKSYDVCVIALEYLIRNPGMIARIVAPTLKQCNDIVQDNLMPIILDAPSGMIERVRAEYRWNLLNKSSLRLGALERAHVDGNRGGNAGLVIYEECGFVGAEDFNYGVNSVLGPQLLRSQGREIFVSSPSEDPDHPLHTRILPECEANGTAFRYTVYESPSITPEMIAEAARRCGGVESDAFQREYMARIIRPSTLMVVPHYDEALHVGLFDYPLECHKEVAIDFGGVRDKTVALLHSYDFVNNVDLVFEERVFEPNTPTSVVVASLREWDTAHVIKAKWADVHGQTQIDLAALGYQVVLPQKTDWLTAVNRMSTCFTTNRIKVHERCTFLRRSLKAGIFNKNRTDFERLPELGHCDALAALMYALRQQDRSNPYPLRYNADNIFYTERPRGDFGYVDAYDSKRFAKGMPRSFGSFRK